MYIVLEEKITLKRRYYYFFILSIAMFLLFSVSFSFSSDEQQSFYTVQIASFTDIQQAKDAFESFKEKLKEVRPEYLRIEKIGKYYSIRAGKFNEQSDADLLLESIKKDVTSAIVMNAYFIEERIIEMYEDRDMPVHETKPKEPDKKRIITKEVKKGNSKEETKELKSEPLYSAGPWTGKVLDPEDNMPVEGAVVVASWTREYATRFTVAAEVHHIVEVLTDKNGYFEIPAFTETGEGKENWRKPQIEGPDGRPIELFYKGPEIKGPNVIIYKEGYHYFPKKVDLIVFATDSFTIEYPEFYRALVSGENVTLSRNMKKDYPEGLVYAGERCMKRIWKFRVESDFRTDSLFLPLQGAVDKIGNLDISLNCPKYTEPLPSPMPGYRYGLKEPLKDGGFVVLVLSKVVPDEDPLKGINDVLGLVQLDMVPLLKSRIEKVKDKTDAEEAQEK
jgi:hypothetical protein